MTAATLRTDLHQTRARTSWTMSASFVAHALLVLWLALHPVKATDLTPITEITLLDPGDLAPSSPAPAPAAPRGRTTEGFATRSASEEHFKRATTKGEVEPDPQSSWSFEDRLQARLAAMQQNQSTAGAGIATSKAPTSIFGTAPAVMSGGTGLGTPMTLTRGGGGGGPPLPLARGGGTGSAPTLATVAESHHGNDAPAPARSVESSARRTVAGASITGPIADRPIMTYAVPTYPEWAKHDAVEGAVTLYFVVRADGGVKENILVQKTAGFEDFDENARVALRAWRFRPLAPGQSGEQWGTITFRYRLSSAG
jgi:TonB family protein